MRYQVKTINGHCIFESNNRSEAAHEARNLDAQAGFEYCYIWDTVECIILRPMYLV